MVSGRLQDVNRPAGDEFLGLARVSRHVRRGGVHLERAHALPLLDDDEGIRPQLGLERKGRVCIKSLPVLDAALLCAHGKPTEIDHLNGYVVRRGEALGIPTPANRVLRALVKLLESKK